uniref:Phorbol-ester/DAG-type domain-containing protein n=1 Tax=Macrostomum lignano TaxID=282301 RepID=A0A1I8JLP9_9PLAT
TAASEGADSHQNDGSRCCSRGRRRCGPTGDGLAAIPPGCSTISARAPALLVAADGRRRRPRPPSPRLEKPEADRQLGPPAQPHRAAGQLAAAGRETRKLKRSWPSREREAAVEGTSEAPAGGPSTPVAQVAAPTSQNSKRNNGTATAAAAAATLSGKPSWSSSKEAGQSQQLKENIQEEQDEEEEDPDIGVESFVSGDISRPCPESEAVQTGSRAINLRILEEHLNDYRKLKQNSQAMLVFLHCLLARGAESGQTGSSLWPVVLRLAGRGLERCHRLHQAEALPRRYAYEIYSTFLHEESPLSLLASNSTPTPAGSSCTTKRCIRLSGSSASAPPPEPTRRRLSAQPLINRAQALMAPTLARLATGALADLAAKTTRRLSVGPAAGAAAAARTPEQRRLFAARCRPGLLARLRMLRQSQSAPAAAEASCLAPPAGARPRSGTGRVAGAGRVADVVRLPCQHRSAEVSAKPDGRARGLGSLGFVGIWSGAPTSDCALGRHALEPCALTKAQVCAACDRPVLYGGGATGAAMHRVELQNADCEQVVHRSCAQQLSSALCTKRAAARAKDASIGSATGGDCAISGTLHRAGVRRLQRDASTTICRWRIDEVEDWMLSGRQVQRNNPDCGKTVGDKEAKSIKKAL